MSFLLVIIIAAAPIFITVSCIQVWHWYRKRKPRRSPLTRALLRSPGESLRRQVDDLTWDISMWLALLMVLPLMFYAAYLSQASLFGVKASALYMTIAALTAFGFSLCQLIRLAEKRRRLRQGLDGEMAVGQELIELLKDGMSVYHDIQADQFNIDHVVAGPSGVFAVETKCHAKLWTGKGKTDAAVKVKGDALLFPGWTETRWVDQARWRSRWLADWLTSAVGERVEVKPMLALPGWFIDIEKSSDVLVINPKNSRALMQKIKGTPLTAEQVRRITHVLEQRCRDVEAQEI